MSTPALLSMQIQGMWLETPRILGIELRASTGTKVAPAEPGAHITLHLPGNMRRSYSLLPTIRSDSYRIAVQLDRASRGGSRHIHQRLRLGEQLQVSAPRHAFALAADASSSVLIAGGIGITPILSMWHRLRQQGARVNMLYCGRQRSDMAFAEQLQHVDVRWHVDAEQGGSADLEAYMAGFPAQSDYYCCGPAAMLDAFARAGAALGRERLHMERFASEMSSTPAGGFELELARSGSRLRVAAGASILQTLLDAGMDVEHGCGEGGCGACEVTVLEGKPEHRDSVLSAKERQANRTMMICVSGCAGERLVLDL